MDTNTVALLVQSLVNQRPSEISPWVVIVGMVLASVAPTLASIASYLQSRANRENSDATHAIVVESKGTINNVQGLVNGDRDRMTNLVNNLREEILKLSQHVSTLEEHARGVKTAEEVLAKVSNEPSKS